MIGRSPEADWQIDDPDMFVSRAHCKITSGHDGYFVTDMSSSGLFIDDAGSPLGAGNSTRLKNGMRLRLGDYVLWVDLQARRPTRRRRAAERRRLPRARRPASMATISFRLKAEEEPRRARPRDLPNPFEQPKPGRFRRSSAQAPASAVRPPSTIHSASIRSPRRCRTAGAGQRGAPASNDPFGFDSARPMRMRNLTSPGKDHRLSMTISAPVQQPPQEMLPPIRAGAKPLPTGRLLLRGTCPLLLRKRLRRPGPVSCP